MAVGLSVAVMMFVVSDSRASPRGPSERIDPGALATLARATTYLRSLAELDFTADVSRDEIVHGDFKLQRSQTVRVFARRPNRLRVEVAGDQGKRLFVYDGKQLGVHAKDENLYGQVPAPPTLLDTIDAIEPYAIELPVLDLIYVAMGGELDAYVKDAGEIGTSVVEGTPCMHLAFRGELVDWQLWTQRGDKPLLRKLVITTRDEATRPQYSALIRWVASPHLKEDLFKFVPPADAQRMSLGRLAAERQRGLP